jgi:hypothetical protein
MLSTSVVAGPSTAWTVCHRPEQKRRIERVVSVVCRSGSSSARRESQLVERSDISRSSSGGCSDP